MKIRLMQLSDQEALAQLWEPENMLSDTVYLHRILEHNPKTCFVGTINEQVIGATCGLYDGRRGVLQSVAVLPNERGKGYGKALVLHTVDALKALGTDRIRLFVMTHNTKAIGFYQKLGFLIHDQVHYMGLP